LNINFDSENRQEVTLVLPNLSTHFKKFLLKKPKPEKGLAATNVPQNIWRLLTVDEAACGMAGHWRVLGLVYHVSI
jgi:hypothetical protein